MSNSIDGYIIDAERLIPAFEALSASEVLAQVLDFLPEKPSRIVDIGAGTGRDSAWLASQGHRLTAVEPVAQFRKAAMDLHPSDSIQWIDDSLPYIQRIFESRATFDLVLLVAVWQHLSLEERRVSLANMSKLLSREGRLIMSLRHGPGPADRECFPVSVEETVALAGQNNLKVLARRSAESVQATNKAAGVTWTWLVLAN